MFYRFSPELVLRSSWRPYRPRPGERVLVLAAASVFPPGHTATRLCLDLLTETLAAAPGSRLLDVGCGSGVLLLAGVAAGAQVGVGVDISGRAVAATRDNARANDLAAAVQVVRGSTECLRGAFGVMLGNLPWAVQMDKVAEFTRLAAPDACLILSGFKDTQEDDLRLRYEQAGWVLSSRLTRDESVIELPPEKSFTWVAWRLTRH
ncbi:MAG: methyltransferase [Deltaproteobacteria bacterium]|nr:methyltransferase [Deltaproteobacteria bacterium]